MILRRRLLGVLGQLGNEGLLTEPQLEALRGEASKTASGTPWFVRALVGAGAWVASIFVLVLLAMMDVFNTKAGAAGVGLVLLGLGSLLRRFTRGDFAVQLAISLGMAGAAMIVFGAIDDTATALATAFVVAVVIIAAFPDTAMRFLATCVASGSTVLLFHELKLGPDAGVALIAVLAGLTWICEARLHRNGWTAALQTPVGFGLVFSLLAILVAAVTELDQAFLIGPASAASITLATVVLIVAILQEHRVRLLSEPALVAAAAALVLGGVMFESPGVMAAFFVAGLAFHRRNPILLGLAITTLVVFVVFFYYRLEVTLLLKSGVLCGSGLLLLGLREYVRRRYQHLPEEQLQ